MIEVRDLHVRFGDFELRDVNLVLPSDGCLAVLGPSGAGKTLLLETVMGARRPMRGSVLIDGRNVSDLPPESRKIAYIPQDLGLFPHLSVRENIVFGLSDRRARKNAEAEVLRLARLLQVEHLLDRKRVTTLSGGEKQRVALARSLIVNPRVLFLDEPFSSLDAATSSELLRTFRVMRRDLGTTVFLVTHDLDHACFLADDVAIMMAGRIVESGPCEQVLRRPRNVAVARFLNVRNIIPISSLPPSTRPIVATTSRDVTHLAFRAEDVSLVPGSLDGGLTLPARLEGLIPLTSHVVAELTILGSIPVEANISRAAAEHLDGHLGAAVNMHVARERILLLSHLPVPS